MVLTAREVKREPSFARSLTLVPRSLLLNRTETLATQASDEHVVLFSAMIEVMRVVDHVLAF